MNNKKVFVAGYRGMVGSACVRRLREEACEIVTCDLDLRRQVEVENWFAANRPEVVILAAAKVGGILANHNSPADFLYDNVMIEANVIHAAALHGVEKLLFLGSSCVYPKDAPQPIPEEALLSGALEPTNEAYAIAKIAGLKLCAAYRAQKGCDFIVAMPCNLYGPGDRYDLETSHVIPALMMKIHAAKESGTETVEIWGSGAPLREFLHVDDLADGLVFLLQHYSDAAPINIGSGEEISIQALANMLCEIVGYQGTLHFDPSKPDGVMRKCIDSSRINHAGWVAKTKLKDGLENLYQEYCTALSKNTFHA